MTVTRLFWLSLVFIMSACTGFSAEQTAIANRDAVGTQVNLLALTNTVESARLQTTVDYAVTRVSVVATQSQLLKATLVGRGTPLVDLNNMQGTAMSQYLAVTPSPTSDMALGNNMDDMSDDTQSLDADTIQPTAPVLTLNAPRTPTPFGFNNSTNNTNSDIPDVAPVSGVGIQNILLGDDVGADDCVYAPQRSFLTNSPAIYVSMIVNNAPARTTFSTAWFAPGGQQVEFSFSPDFEIDGSCIWFFIDSTDIEFAVGDWRTEIRVNGTTAGSVGFTMQ